MSPEQANGEGHRVDGRSDIFSLGVVFYELLTGKRPFRGDASQILIAIVADEPRPPRQIDDTIPRELERICLKALSKRAADRYTTAKDLADDLRHFLHQATTSGALDSAPLARRASEGDDDQRHPSLARRANPATPSSDHRPLRIVPKGLRSFDAHDADFFLELLPGPRDRDGLPESIRFRTDYHESRSRKSAEATGRDERALSGVAIGPTGGKRRLLGSSTDGAK